MLHRRFSVETIAKSVLEPLEKPAKVTSTSDRDDSRSPHDSLKNPRSAEVRLFARNILIGAAAASFAVALRYSIGLPDGVLTFFTVIIAVCLVTVKTGLAGGITTAVLGGVLNWYFVLTPRHSLKLDSASLWVLLGFFSTAIVILATSQLYRLSERKRQAALLSRAVQDAEQQRLFAREMAHRLKNAIAIVQAMAAQTFSRDDPELPKFNGRLRALADAHALLNEHVQQPSASVDELVVTAVRPFNDRPNRFTIAGPEATIPDQQVISLALALHELCTNAVKYGALSKSCGRVSIDWTLVDGKLRLEWKEHDGPAVAEPVTKGFGSRLLARAAMGAEVRYESDGLRCVISQRF